MIEQNIPLVDLAVYVLDARAAVSSINPSLDAIVKNKPVIYVLNKADLVEKSAADRIIAAFRAEGKNIIALNSAQSGAAEKLAAAAFKLCAPKLERYAAKGVKASIRAIVLGVPNSGKSTLINNLSGYGATTTGNKPGVTRGRQWIRVNEYFEVLDTPGTLYPKLSNQTTARRLAYIGSIRDEIADSGELALDLIAELDALSPAYISGRYKAAEGTAEERLTAIAKSRGMIKKGGAPDEEKAATALIDDFRKGRLGKIALE